MGYATNSVKMFSVICYCILLLLLEPGISYSDLNPKKIQEWRNLAVQCSFITHLFQKKNLVRDLPLSWIKHTNRNPNPVSTSARREDGSFGVSEKLETLTKNVLKMGNTSWKLDAEQPFQRMFCSLSTNIGIILDYIFCARKSVSFMILNVKIASCFQQVVTGNLSYFSVLDYKTTKGHKICTYANLKSFRINYFARCCSNILVEESEICVSCHYSAMDETLNLFSKVKFFKMRTRKVTKPMLSCKGLLLNKGFWGFLMERNMVGNLFESMQILTSLEMHVFHIGSINMIHIDINYMSKGLSENLQDKQLQNRSHDDLIHSKTCVFFVYSQIAFEPFMCKTSAELTINVSLIYSGIQLSCTRTLTLDIEQPNMSKVKFFNELERLRKCLLQDDTTMELKNYFHQLRYITNESDNTSLAFFFYILYLILVSLSALAYKNWWKVKHAWYTVLQLLYRKEQERIDFQFDAFIAYCNTDEEWVRTRLVPALEQDGGHKYKLCLHYRHFIPGRDIADNIVSAVQSSRKTILIVTKHYLRSGWCEFETKFAHSHHLQKHSGGIIALVHPAVFKMKGNMASALDRLLDTVTYLEWPKEADEEALLWLSLRRTLGPPLPINVK